VQADVVARERLLGAIARAHQRARHAFAEAALEAPGAVALELLRRDEALDRKVIDRGAEVLAQRQDVDATRWRSSMLADLGVGLA
jgi:hypothetical protein